MKKIIYIILLFIPAVSAAADARVERWNSRIERISKYRDEALKIPANETSAVKLFSDEIKSAEEFLSILEKYSAGSGSVKAENKKFTIEEIEAFTAQTAGPIITVHYAVELIRSRANPETKSAIINEINSHGESKGLPPLKKNRETDSLVNEYILQKYMSGYEKYKEQAYKEILGMAQYELSRTNYNSNHIDLSEIILKTTEKVASAGLNNETAFNTAHLLTLPRWKEHEQNGDTLKHEIETIAAFAESQGAIIAPDDRAKGIAHIENLTFLSAKTPLIEMCSNTEKSPSTGYNNPAYEIPDFKRIITAIDEIDRYRGAVSSAIPAGNISEYINTIKHNNRGIAERYLKQYDNLFKRERMRIAGLKKSSGTIIYNEEIFNAAERHFTEIDKKLRAYADISSGYLESLLTARKFNPDIYLEQYSAETEKSLEHASFIERLTADASEAGKFPDTKINNLYRAGVKELFTMMKTLYTPESIPADIRITMNRDHIKKHAAINANLRTKGTALAASARKNYEEYISAYTEALNALKSKAVISETSIGQNEVDRLMSCSFKYSEAAAALSYTSNALNNYTEKYNNIIDDINRGRDLTQYLETINRGSIIPLVDEFSPERIDSEMKLRDMLIREGNESLSGAVSLMQYYSRRGYTLKDKYTSEDIKKIKERLSIIPEATVASWKMNGKNYRLVDTNSTEYLRKMINRKAWYQDEKKGTESLKEKFSPDSATDFSIILPEGWNRTAKGDDNKAAISVVLQSPDLLGRIFLRAVKYDSESIQTFSEDLNKTENFTPVAKEWGKHNGTDYLYTVSKNNYNSIMESYVIHKDGYMIQVSGIADKKKHSVMNKSLKKVFSSLEL